MVYYKWVLNIFRSELSECQFHCCDTIQPSSGLTCITESVEAALWHRQLKMTCTERHAAENHFTVVKPTRRWALSHNTVQHTSRCTCLDSCLHTRFLLYSCLFFTFTLTFALVILLLSTLSVNDVFSPHMHSAVSPLRHMTEGQIYV